jgi:TRAP-type mannitol/chloroaromatic compound transport system substrate-binding protein
MRSQKHKITATLAIATIVLALLVSPAFGEKPIEWKCQVFWGAAELSYKTFVDFTERVKVLTNGRLIITPYPGGTIVPTFEALDALQNNVIQAMHMWPGYFSGKEPAFAAKRSLDVLQRRHGHAAGNVQTLQCLSGRIHVLGH